MYEVGKLCVKIAGKDAGKTVIIVDKIDESFVMIDGPVKRKRCNIKHLEPFGEIIKIKKGASTEEVKSLLEGRVKVPDKKPRTSGEKPRKQRKIKIKEEKKIKKESKKEKKIKKESKKEKEAKPEPKKEEGKK